MASLQSLKRLPTLQINDRTIAVEPRETVLQAALRQGIDFPNACRVGGCGSCKCKLKSGQVEELTESGYLLTADEIDKGYILACQSVPQSDLEIEVDLDQASQRGVPGRVIVQEKITHDIVRLTIQLEQPIAYQAGQFANLSIEGLPGVIRSYSFASPASRDGRVSFFVRKVPGGVFSTLLNDEDVLGRSMRVDGPHGNFWLRPGNAPLMLIAGGSGLAPILALLKEALTLGVSRSVTLLFGAREQRDLYALSEINAIARAWQGSFKFVPVLSAEPADSDWEGARGLVTEQIVSLLEPGSHGYLCGPPAMIDGAVALLAKAGLRHDHIHADRFTTQADAAQALAAVPMRFSDALDYLKYFAFHFVGLCALIATVVGGRFATLGLLAVVGLYMLGDAYLGDDVATPSFRFPRILTVQLWLALPLLSLIVFAAVWTVSPGDPLGFGAWVQDWSTYDVFAARERTQSGHLFSIFVLTGLMIGMIGTITAHELTHRTWDPISMAVGRWLLAFSFDTNFAIEHVYGHHRYVSTTEDPATAPRGRNVYAHVVISTIRGNISAWKIEVDRLKKKKHAVYSWHNAVIRGQLMSAVWVALAYAMGGLQTMAFFIVCALWGKGLLEIVNYMEHYGMVRNPETPVQPRHSWNTNRRITSWTMFNLSRHSHHHAQGEVPYHELKPYPNAPMMISGYLTTISLAMIPPLWHKLMTPRVLAWDRNYANAEELELAALANARSGVPEFMEGAGVPKLVA